MEVEWTEGPNGARASVEKPRHDKPRPLDAARLGIGAEHLLDRERHLLEAVYGGAAALGAFADDGARAAQPPHRGKADVAPHHAAFLRTTPGTKPHSVRPPWRSANSKDANSRDAQAAASAARMRRGVARDASTRVASRKHPGSVEEFARRGLASSRRAERRMRAHDDAARLLRAASPDYHHPVAATAAAANAALVANTHYPAYGRPRPASAAFGRTPHRRTARLDPERTPDELRRERDALVGALTVVWEAARQPPVGYPAYYAHPYDAAAWMRSHAFSAFGRL